MRRRLTAAGFAAMIGVAGGAAPASADERVCVGPIGAQTVDDMRVPDGARCVLTGTRVEGNVTVGTGARLIARRARVDGNVQTQGHRSVLVVLGRVGGDLQIEQGRAATVRGVTIGGNLQSFQNRGAQIFRGNRIDGGLQCKQNSPPPRGGGNVVGEGRGGQCRRL